MTGSTEPPALIRYRTHAERLGKRFQALSTEDVLKSVADFLPQEPARILDVGAGSGRDTAWFASHGHKVTSVEPVTEMAGQAESLPGAGRATWMTDHLPDLKSLAGREATYDLCLLSGIWHHLSHGDRPIAFARLAELLRPGGLLLMSLRLGQDFDNQTVFTTNTDDTIQLATGTGLALLHCARTPSIQAANIAASVTWAWLVLERPMGRTS